MDISHCKEVPLSWANALWSVLTASYLGQGETEGFPVEVMGPDSFGSQVDHGRPSGLESLLAVPAFATHDAGFPTVRGACPAWHVRSSLLRRVRGKFSCGSWPGRPDPARRRLREGWRWSIPRASVFPLLGRLGRILSLSLRQVNSGSRRSCGGSDRCRMRGG